MSAGSPGFGSSGKMMGGSGADMEERETERGAKTEWEVLEYPLWLGRVNIHNGPRRQYFSKVEEVRFGEITYDRVRIERPLGDEEDRNYFTSESLAPMIKAMQAVKEAEFTSRLCEFMLGFWRRAAMAPRPQYWIGLQIFPPGRDPLFEPAYYGFTQMRDVHVRDPEPIGGGLYRVHLRCEKYTLHPWNHYKD